MYSRTAPCRNLLESICCRILVAVRSRVLVSYACDHQREIEMLTTARLLVSAAMYYSLITSLLTVFSKVKDCIGTAAGPSKEPDDSPEEPEEQVAAPDEKDVDQVRYRSHTQYDVGRFCVSYQLTRLGAVGCLWCRTRSRIPSCSPDQVSLAKKEISLLPVASVQRAEKSADMTQEPTTVEP